MGMISRIIIGDNKPIYPHGLMEAQVLLQNILLILHEQGHEEGGL